MPQPPECFLCPPNGPRVPPARLPAPQDLARDLAPSHYALADWDRVCRASCPLLKPSGGHRRRLPGQWPLTTKIILRQILKTELSYFPWKRSPFLLSSWAWFGILSLSLFLTKCNICKIILCPKTKDIKEHPGWPLSVPEFIAVSGERSPGKGPGGDGPPE